jgi:hypothetical protein
MTKKQIGTYLADPNIKEKIKTGGYKMIKNQQTNRKTSIVMGFTLIFLFGALMPLHMLAQSQRAWVRKDYNIEGTHFYPFPANRSINLVDYDVRWDKAEKAYNVLTGDVDGDGEVEIVVTNRQVLRVFDKEGNLEWSINVVASLGALADVNKDGTPEILLSYHKLSTYQGAVLVYDGFGNLLRTLPGPAASDGYFSRCWAGDFDGDGKIEVSVDMVAAWTARPRGLYMFDYESGNLDWFYAIGPSGLSHAGDVDEDGKLEFVFGGGSWHNGGSGAGVNNTARRTTDGDIYTIVFNAENGSELFTLDYFSDGQSNGFVDHAIVDLDHDGNKNILAFEGHSRWYHGTLQVHLIDENGARLKTWNGPYLSSGNAHNILWAAGDLNGDGFDEIVFSFWGMDGLWLLDHNLNEIKKRTFGYSLQNGYYGYHIINDINGDGTNEIIVADWHEGKIRVLDAQLNDIWEYPVASNDFSVVLSDLDNDGINEIIVTGDHLYVLGIPAIVNSPPTAEPFGGGVYEINTPVTLGGFVSDVDGDLINYTWLDGTDVLFSGTVQTTAVGAPAALPDHTLSTLSLGIHTIKIQVDDGVNDPVEETITVEIVDTTPPELAPVADKTLLWPPNHKMVDILIEANASDNSGLAITLEASISSNEPINGPGDGDKSPDWTEPIIHQENGIITFQLRAERSGKGNGRVYTVTITATDTSNNSSTANIEITIPHDMKKK